jgi:hypothetical protein
MPHALILELSEVHQSVAFWATLQRAPGTLRNYRNGLYQVHCAAGRALT